MPDKDTNPEFLPVTRWECQNISNRILNKLDELSKSTNDMAILVAKSTSEMVLLIANNKSYQEHEHQHKDEKKTMSTSRKNQIIIVIVGALVGAGAKGLYDLINFIIITMK